ncbi:MAG: GNAT family N-acetyltransferase [Actinobacteria bacterium]|nr:GNAT family N-acetyltransferase [Actinomycetota bacterium]
MDITTGHNARQRGFDPLLADAPALDAADPGYLEAVDETGAAAGIARFTAVDAASPDAVWGALRRHELDVRVAGEDPGRALGTILDRWLRGLAEQERPGDADSSARVNVPSRDIALVRALTERGFAPNGIRGVRPRPRGAIAAAPDLPVALDGALVRAATVDDAPALGALDARLLALDTHFAGVTERAGAADMFAGAYRERLQAAPDTTWVLERPTGITGFIHVMPDAASPEPGTLALAASGGQYLVVMYLDESERGAGTGAAFCDIAHALLDAAGAPYTLLSYAVANPRSGPFWSRMGYRPVVTEWQRRPAVLAV